MFIGPDDWALLSGVLDAICAGQSAELAGPARERLAKALVEAFREGARSEKDLRGAAEIEALADFT